MKHSPKIAGALSGVVRNLKPETANFERVEFTGGAENRLGELVGQAETREELFAVVTSHGSELGRIGSSMIDESKLDLYFDEEQLDENDRVERIADGKPFRVATSKIYELAGAVVAWRYTIEEVTD